MKKGLVFQPITIELNTEGVSINRISASDISDLIVHSLDYVNKLFRNNYLINRITSKANKPST